MKARVVLLLGCMGVAISAQESILNPAAAATLPNATTNLAPPPTGKLRQPEDSALDSMAPGPLKVVGPGIFELGNVRLDKQQRTVTFPAVLNANQGLMEYFLVTSYGKTHESVLRTETEPYYIHVAMLLLDIRSAGTNRLTAPPPTQLTNPAKDSLPGDKITIDITWRIDGKEIRRPAEELVFNLNTKTTLPHDSWVYNGSSVWNGHFLAQQEGSIMSLITDPVAQINNIGAGHDNDHIWTVNTNSLPPANTPLQVILTLPGSQAQR